MTSVNAYITFNGNCEEAFLFYQSVFGGEFPFLGRFKDMPPTEGVEMTPEQGEKIMHVVLPIGKGSTLMGSDSSDSYGHATVIGNNIALSVNADSREDAERIFNGLSQDGTVTMPLSDTFWGAYFGMFTDKFGINWMVNHDAEEQN